MAVILTVVLVALAAVLAAVVAAALLVRAARERAAEAQGRADAAQTRATEAERGLVEALEKRGKDLTDRGRRAALGARGTFDGHVAEHAFPCLAGHGYHPKDILHVGGTIDFAVFDGLFEIRQGTRQPHELTVILADVKYGSSSLSREQRAIIDAMNQGRTRGECWNAREESGRLLYRPRGEVVPRQPHSAPPDGPVGGAVGPGALAAGKDDPPRLAPPERC